MNSKRAIDFAVIDVSRSLIVRFENIALLKDIAISLIQGAYQHDLVLFIS